MIEVRDLRRDFGGIKALAGVDLSVAPGERRAVIGPNGAGKTTFFNVLTGELAATAGTVSLGGADITALRPWQRARRGLARMYQRNELFDALPAWENVALAAGVRLGTYRALTGISRAERDAATGQLAQVGLDDRADTLARALSHGERRQLELALALAQAPAVLLLDEPTAGLSPAETERIATLIASLDRSLTLLIVEHDMDVVFRLADRITVLHEGRAIAEGTPEEIRGDTQVHDVYLGKALGG
ncbi:MAG TPA: ABC transporter ATP-binding protein [Candidatus Saccharimonadales bacterium]|nr:ABC transporter ATP-binding protein [Candidatus Saccharimonadales bacterium]